MVSRDHRWVLPLASVVVLVFGCEGESSTVVEEVAPDSAEAKAEVEGRAGLFSDGLDKRKARPPTPGKPGSNVDPYSEKPAQESYSHLEEGTLPAASGAAQVGTEAIDLGTLAEAPAEVRDKAGFFKDEVPIPYHEDDRGLAHSDTKFGDRSALQEKRRQLAPRVLEMRLAALGKRVKQMHESWMAERGKPGKRALEREAKELAERLDPLMAKIEERAAVSLHVRDLRTQRTLYDHKGTELRNPASNQKMLTASSALDLLGPEFRFKTEVYSRGETLYLVGGGDPKLTETKIIVMAKELAQKVDVKGIKQFIVDGSNFSEESFIPGIELDGVGFSYMAPTGALSMDGNTISIKVKPTSAGQPALVQVTPLNGHIRIDNQAVTMGGGGERSSDDKGVSIRAVPDAGDTVVIVRGRIGLGQKAVVHKRRIVDPLLFTGESFTKALADAAGSLRLAVRKGERPPNALLVKAWESVPLFDIVQEAMAYSNNFMTEMVLRSLARQMTGLPGSYELGSTVLEGYWATVGVNPEALIAENGSGLSRAGRFTAAGLVDLVSAAHMTQFANSGLVGVLPVAGRPGTLRNRHKEARGRLKAKTGTLNGVSALSGILTDAQGLPLLSLSIMLNPKGVAASAAAVDTQVEEGSSLGVGERHRAEEQIVGALLTYLDSRKKPRPARRGRRR